MRLFVALPLEGEVESELRTRLALPERREWPVRWVRPEGLHLTLKFLGEVAPARVEAVTGVVTQAVGRMGRLSVSLTDFGAFPSFPKARVLWAGLESEPALELLVDRLERGFVALGFPLEGRPFRPHVTLGRVRDGSRLPLAAIRQLEEDRLAGHFVGNRVVLFESHPSPQGSTYTARASFALGA